VPEGGEVERIKAGGGAETVLSLAASYLSAKNRGAVGEGGAHRGLRYDGAVQESEGGRRDAKRRKETLKDAAGDEYAFTLGRALGWQMRQAPTSYIRWRRRDDGVWTTYERS
jgi:hypothetical protein